MGGRPRALGGCVGAFLPGFAAMAIPLLIERWLGHDARIVRGVAEFGFMVWLAWRWRKSPAAGQFVRAALAAGQELIRRRPLTDEQLRVGAPVGAALIAVASFPAAFVAMVAIAGPGANGVALPPVPDARSQIWGIAIVLVLLAGAIDYRFGAGTTARALTASGFTAKSVGISIALAALPALLTLGHIGSRFFWLVLLAAEVAWFFIGFLLGMVRAQRRRVRG